MLEQDTFYCDGFGGCAVEVVTLTVAVKLANQDNSQQFTCAKQQTLFHQKRLLLIHQQ